MDVIKVPLINPLGLDIAPLLINPLGHDIAPLSNI
jgi:hypothetical protein